MPTNKKPEQERTTPDAATAQTEVPIIRLSRADLEKLRRLRNKIP